MPTEKKHNDLGTLKSLEDEARELLEEARRTGDAFVLAVAQGTLEVVRATKRGID